VVLSKNEAIRQAHEGNVDRSRMQVMSKRRVPQERRTDEKDEREKEEAAGFDMNPRKISEKKPESRLKWMQQALLLVGRKNIKAAEVYDICTHKSFVFDVPEAIGLKMKASLLANLHLFNSKQQKYLQSDATIFSSFSEAPAQPKEQPKERGRAPPPPRSGGRSDRRGEVDRIPLPGSGGRSDRRGPEGRRRDRSESSEEEAYEREAARGGRKRRRASPSLEQKRSPSESRSPTPPPPPRRRSAKEVEAPEPEPIPQAEAVKDDGYAAEEPAAAPIDPRCFSAGVAD